MTRARTRARSTESRTRGARLGFRVERQTKILVERAARLESPTVTDFCLTVLTETAKRVVAQHETLVLSESDRTVFFETLVNPPKPNARLRRAARAERHRIEG